MSCLLSGDRHEASTMDAVLYRAYAGYAITVVQVPYSKSAVS